MSRKVIGPEILYERLEFMRGKSIWYYIDILNAGLRTDSVDPEANVSVTIDYNINTELILQIKSFYLTAGWEDVKITLTGNVESLYGTTIFKFIPPDDSRKKIKRLVREEL